MIRITLNQALLIHDILAEESGGVKGVRDIGLLDSSLNTPFQTFGGDYVYKKTEERITQIAYLIINNHPFIDGNKRMGIFLLVYLSELNGFELNFTDEKLIKLGIGIADGTIKSEDLTKWYLKQAKKKR